MAEKQKGINLHIVEEKEKLMQWANQSQLPPSVLRLLLSEMINLVTSLDNEQIKKEREAYERDNDTE